LKKTLRIASGSALIATGAILAIPGIPGPGIALIIVGLLLLSDHFEWARRALDWLRAKTAGFLRRTG
jgi:hypothetical protein